MDTQITFSPVAQNFNKSSETLRDEFDYESEFKSLKGIAGRNLNLDAQKNDIKLVSSSANNVDCIVTRNKGDFEEDKIPCYTPVEFVKKFSC